MLPNYFPREKPEESSEICDAVIPSKTAPRRHPIPRTEGGGTQKFEATDDFHSIHQTILKRSLPWLSGKTGVRVEHA